MTINSALQTLKGDPADGAQADELLANGGGERPRAAITQGGSNNVIIGRYCAGCRTEDMTALLEELREERLAAQALLSAIGDLLECIRKNERI